MAWFRCSPLEMGSPFHMSGYRLMYIAHRGISMREVSLLRFLNWINTSRLTLRNRSLGCCEPHFPHDRALSNSSGATEPRPIWLTSPLGQCSCSWWPNSFSHASSPGAKDGSWARRDEILSGDRHNSCMCSLILYGDSVGTLDSWIVGMVCLAAWLPGCIQRM